MTTPHSRRALLGSLVLKELQEEARMERALARFTQCDDTPNPPEADPLASAQSRRAQRLPVSVH